MNLEQALEDIQVHAPGMWENNIGPKDWFAVSTGDDGIIAYFGSESNALSFRLHLIDRLLNK